MGIAALAVAAVAGVARQQQVAGETISVIVRDVIPTILSDLLPEAIQGVIPDIFTDPVFTQRLGDRLDVFADDLRQTLTAEFLTSQTARLDAPAALQDLTRAGLPIGRNIIGLSDNFVRAERRRKFLERQEERRSRESNILFALDIAKGLGE